MARLESTAIAGYYPTPSSVLPVITSFLHLSGEGSYDYVDPCAGDGSAILDVIERVHEGILQSNAKRVSLHSIELEKTRHAGLRRNVDSRLRDYASQQAAANGDAFRVAWEKHVGSCLLWLNPPYDIDPIHGRLEEKFLSRFAGALQVGGVLVFLVPFYALKASAMTLAKEFEGITCYRFPGEEFETYKQVALFATKRESTLWEPDPVVIQTIQSWAADASSIPVLVEQASPSYQIPTLPEYEKPFNEWRVVPLDLRGLLSKVKPWCTTDRMGNRTRIPGIVPEGSLEDLLVRKYPVAMPPRSAHIAAGIAAGVFNGARIAPDKADSQLPHLLVKGVFDKEFRTVDEKTDKDGNVKGVIQVQQPKLVTTVLDLSSSTYVTIKPTAEITGATCVTEMTMADLLAEYGRGLMEVMLRQCPVLHDPSRVGDTIPLPELARPLYEAQAHATMATLKLLGGAQATKKERRHKAVFVLGEIGSGKTSVALATAQATQSKRVLVMCPPHLLTSWQDQIQAVVPWYRTVVLSDVGDVQKLAAMHDDVPTIAILSREVAKLGHAHAALNGVCGGCGVPVDTSVDHAKKRSRCGGRRLLRSGPLGALTHELAVDLLHVFPEDFRSKQIIQESPLLTSAARWSVQKTAAPEVYTKAAWHRLRQRRTMERLIEALLEIEGDWALQTIELLLVADPRPDLVLNIARALYEWAIENRGNSYSELPECSRARTLLLLVPPCSALQTLVEQLQSLDPEEKPYSSYGRSPWQTWAARHDVLWSEGQDHAYDHNSTHIERNQEGTLLWRKYPVGTKSTALEALLIAAKQCFHWSSECTEPLYQAIPEPRRFPVATFIARKYPSLFDLLVLDEGHEYATDGSAQERSAHRLTSLGIPALLLTGTIMNGYAESLFTNMWALSADFRHEFDRDERSRYVDRFGYRKRLVEDKDKDTGKVVEYGTMTDRVERVERMIGDAPGVLPLFLLRYLLPLSVTLHKTDLAVDIPKCSELVEFVTPHKELADRFDRLQRALIAQIKADRFKPEVAGKLWGAMAGMPSYLDLATEDTGNTDDGRYEVRYPESVGGDLVVSIDPFPASTLLPKEAWMLAHVESALAAGRNVLVFAWHTRLLPRLVRLIEKHTGKKCPMLDPTKVPTKKRETWITQEIVKKKHRVLVVNPVTIQTGLNNLVYFADQVWMENPGCNPVIYRQGVGRVDRIGQRNTTRIYFPLYEGTSQRDLHSLLLHKVAVSMSTDGLDAESALLAAGVGEDTGFSSFAVGRQLYELLTKERPRTPARRLQASLF
jgi:hypothetical protein